MKTAAQSTKHGRSTVLGKEMFLLYFYFYWLHLNESREGFCRRGRGRSFHDDGSKTEKAREPTAESLLRGIWRLRVSEAEWRVQDKGV